MTSPENMKMKNSGIVYFKTFAEAEAAGYTYPITRGPNRDIDVSGGNSYGYQFRRGDQTTVAVWASDELNRARQRGAFQPMFQPNTPAKPSNHKTQ